MNISSRDSEIFYHEESLLGFDAVIPRIGASITFYGTAVLRQFEIKGIFSLNDSTAITRSRDKLRAMQLLAKRGMDLPITGFADSTDDVDVLIEKVGGAPVVIKILEGTQGIGVMLAESKQAAASVIQAFLGMRTYIMVQEYIKEAEGADIRCFVVDGKVVAAIERKAKSGDFRANIHRGGRAKAIKITPEERKLAVRAAKMIGLNVAGVDLLRSKRGPLVLEINSSPGLEGIETATKKNVAGKIIDFIEKSVNQRPRKESPT
jgi:ribosomal protein S6--L-glutamate ligase